MKEVISVPYPNYLLVKLLTQDYLIKILISSQISKQAIIVD